mmetsp:Transcript_28007/g.34195  ORF Transcript_28007/g.34195 Transcript_28007/m.34195 type:complete len:139 (+) Transcript_28007:1-417(+)
MELKWSWYVVYFLVSLLFLGGMFDSWIELFNGGAAATLENQLDALRRNGGAGAPAQAQAEAGQQAEQTENAAANEGTNEAGEGAVARETAGEPEREAGAAEAVPPQAPPPFWQRFIYQLFVMFFLTLMPWWTPNPRYM